MQNRIAELLEQLRIERGIKVTEFARMCGLPNTTVYGARDRKSMDNISIDVFLKIAHGFGMTAEELYYGTPRENMYDDPMQQGLNESYEALDKEQQQIICDVAKTYATMHTMSSK